LPGPTTIAEALGFPAFVASVEKVPAKAALGLAVVWFRALGKAEHGPMLCPATVDAWLPGGRRSVADDVSGARPGLRDRGSRAGGVAANGELEVKRGSSVAWPSDTSVKNGGPALAWAGPSIPKDSFSGRLVLRGNAGWPDSEDSTSSS
jgi:hypothetical protein